MRVRRYLATSDDDEGDAPPKRSPKEAEETRSSHRRRKRMKIYDDDDEEEEEEEAIQLVTKTKRDNIKSKDEEEEEEQVSPPEEEEAVVEDGKPVGDVVRVSGKGKARRNHYKSFEYDGITYELEDPVLLVPEGSKKKPYVAIIKDIAETKKGSVMVTGQWFYRPEEAEKKNGGNWQSSDTRELFYSFHRDEVPAESVMHKCVVHFIPANKQIPKRKIHPGFIVQKVYDTIFKRLYKLTDKDYEDNMQHEIDLLVQKTMSRLGDLPDLKIEDDIVELEDQLKSKRLLRRKNMSLLDVTRDDDVSNRTNGPLSKSETPGSCNSISSEYYNILLKFEAVSGDQHRDRWLEKLLEGVQFVCINADGSQAGVIETDGAEDKILKNGTESPLWPDDAVRAVSALELASHESLSSDYQKYNQKMRQLCFNLKKNAQLARRLLKGELEASKILNMSPTELKEGLTAEEKASKEPEEDAQVQMTDARCKRCTEKKVRLIEIISAGHVDRYQLECIACGNMWYASRDEASSLTIDGPTSAKALGPAPWATAKFEDVEKKLVGPTANKKSTEPERQNKPRPQDQTDTVD